MAVENDVWFSGGLAFTCQGCGECCRGPGGIVWISEREIEGMAKKLNLPVNKFMRRYIRMINGEFALVDNAKGDCVFLLEDGRCQLYRERPQQCRTFPWWPEIIKNRDSWENSHYDCPGINRGEIHPAEEIIRKLEEKG